MPASRAASVPASQDAVAGHQDAVAGRRDVAVGDDDDAVAGLRPDLGTLSYDELLRHTVETARDVVTADAAYALVADEDGELRVRAAAGVGVSDALFAPSVPAVFADGAAAKSLVTVPFLVDGRVTGVLGAAATSSDRFDGDDAARLQRVADRVAMSLERARLSELERKRRGRIGFLAEASELLASTLDQEKTISLIAQLVVPRLASWCAVLLADDAGALQPAYVWHADESLIDPLACLLDSVDPPDAAEAGRSWSLAVATTSGLPEEAAAWPPTRPGASRSPRAGGASAWSSSAARAVTGPRAKRSSWPRTWPAGPPSPWTTPGCTSSSS